MKKLIIFLMLIALSSSAYSDEIIVGFEDKDKVVLNEELRTMRRDSKRIDTRVDILETMETTWTDYSATSTIVGWSSFTTKSIYTKKIGKTVFVSYSIAGTSNAATASFTVPYTIASPNFYSVSGYASDAGGNPVAGNIVVVAGGVAIDLRKDATTNAAWTASGTKMVLGRFSYESA